jgi:prepilin-type N-terminal cleavage/methylation domain-containing protein
MMYKGKNKSGGYSLVEVLVAITVLLIALVGPLTIAYAGLKRANFSQDQTAAIFLAQEGIEAIVKLREDGALSADSFSNLAQLWSAVSAVPDMCYLGSENYCGVTIPEDGNISAASFYQCDNDNCLMQYQDSASVPFKQGDGVSGVETIYTRRMQFDLNSSEGYVHVQSEVLWGESSPQSVTLDTYIYNTYYEP